MALRLRVHDAASKKSLSKKMTLASAATDDNPFFERATAQYLGPSTGEPIAAMMWCVLDRLT